MLRVKQNLVYNLKFLISVRCMTILFTNNLHLTNYWYQKFSNLRNFLHIYLILVTFCGLNREKLNGQMKLSLFKMGGGKKAPTLVPPATSQNVGVNPQNFLTFSLKVGLSPSKKFFSFVSMKALLN